MPREQQPIIVCKAREQGGVRNQEVPLATPRQTSHQHGDGLIGEIAFNQSTPRVGCRVRTTTHQSIGREALDIPSRETKVTTLLHGMDGTRVDQCPDSVHREVQYLRRFAHWHVDEEIHISLQKLLL
jgi:hypothetical protein